MVYYWVRHITPSVRIIHRITQSVGASGGVYKGQGRYMIIQCMYSYSCTDASYRMLWVYTDYSIYQRNDHWSQYKINELEDWHPESLTVWPLELAAPADVLSVTWRLRLIPAQQPVQSQSSGRRDQKPRTFRGNAPQCSWFSAWWDGTHSIGRSKPQR